MSDYLISYIYDFIVKSIVYNTGVCNIKELAIKSVSWRLIKCYIP